MIYLLSLIRNELRFIVFLRFFEEKLLVFDVGYGFLLDFLGLALLDELFEGFKDAIAGSLLFEAEHVLFVIVHDSEAESAFVLEVLFGDLEMPDFELAVILFLIGFFLYVKVG